MSKITSIQDWAQIIIEIADIQDGVENGEIETSITEIDAFVQNKIKNQFNHFDFNDIKSNKYVFNANKGDIAKWYIRNNKNASYDEMTQGEISDYIGEIIEYIATVMMTM